MRAAVFALLLAPAAARARSNRTLGEPCRCREDVPVPFNAGAGATCSIIGDPHVTTFDEQTYDFMGEGTYQLFKATTSCGCDVEVQTFHESSTQLIGIPPLFSASAVTAVSMSAGNATLWINANLHLRVVGETSLMPDDAGEEGVVYAGVLCRKKTATKGPHTVNGWALSIPGGGELLVYSFPKTSTSSGAVLATWVSLPAELAASATGLCAQTCTKLRPRPEVATPTTGKHPSGGLCGDDVCLPVFTEHAIFPVDALTDLELAMAGASSTRTSFTDCVGKDSSTHCYGNGTCAPVSKRVSKCAAALLDSPSAAASGGYWWEEDTIDLVYWGAEDATSVEDAPTECAAWCESLVSEECLVSNAVLQGKGVELGCGHVTTAGTSPPVGTCAAVIGQYLMMESITNDNYRVRTQRSPSRYPYS